MSNAKVPEKDKAFYIACALLAIYGLSGVAVTLRFPEYFKDYLSGLSNFVALAVGYYLGSKKS
jgi:hypothetical protein